MLLSFSVKIHKTPRDQDDTRDSRQHGTDELAAMRVPFAEEDGVHDTPVAQPEGDFGRAFRVHFAPNPAPGDESEAYCFLGIRPAK